MSIEAAIVLLIWIAIIVCLAWVLVYLAKQAGAPQPAIMIVWVIAFLLVLLILLRHVGVLHAHEFYTGQRGPDGKIACCNNRDCAPREVRLNTDTLQLEILIQDRWWLAEDPRYFLGASPDGSWHGCMMPRDPGPRCVWGGAGA